MSIQDIKGRSLIKQIIVERDEAQQTGLCVECRRPALEHCYSPAGKAEFGISGLCEECFDRICNEMESEEGST